MCFSAAGSFAVAGILAGVGATSIARNSSTPHRMLATIPLLFAAQQAAEGIVWLTLADSPQSTLHRMAVHGFLWLALVVWPIWVPRSLQLVERDPARRRLLNALFWFGCIVAVSAAFALLRWAPVASIAGHSIRYNSPASRNATWFLLMLFVYVVPTVVPFFVSTANLARTIGTTFVVALMVTVVFERDTLTSVWCFFAAILSGLVAAALTHEERRLARAREATA